MLRVVRVGCERVYRRVRDRSNHEAYVRASMPALEARWSAMFRVVSVAEIGGVRSGDGPAMVEVPESDLVGLLTDVGWLLAAATSRRSGVARRYWVLVDGWADELRGYNDDRGVVVVPASVMAGFLSAVSLLWEVWERSHRRWWWRNSRGPQIGEGG